MEAGPDARPERIAVIGDPELPHKASGERRGAVWINVHFPVPDA
jgi:hypothetical protein